jgi:Na+/proline symporter
VLQLFMAVIATASAEQIAVSSITAYDVYKEYINPKATGQQMVLLSRVMVVVYAALSGELGLQVML